MKPVDLGERNERSRQLYSNQAIDLAMQGRWEEAVKLNRMLLELFPSDVGTYNRLGKALVELGEYAGARQAYSQALSLDPQNKIAMRNLQRLPYLEGEGQQGGPKGDSRHYSASVFIQEAGKTASVNLTDLASRQALARLSVGDEMELKVDGQRLIVEDGGGNHIGQVEPKYELRLIKLMRGGNRYSAVLGSVSEREVRIIVREVYQHPGLAGTVSFPTDGGGESFQGYEDRSMVDYSLEDDEEEGFAEETEGKGEKEGFTLGRGFHEVSPVEEPVTGSDDGGNWDSQTDQD